MPRPGFLRARWFAILAVFATLGITSVSSAATFRVTSTLDTDDALPGDGVCNDGSGHCTLRAAITETNALPGPDVIGFIFFGAGPFTISPLSDLPPITDPVTIDGFTQPFARPNTNPFGLSTNASLKIEINGSLVAGFGNGFEVKGGGSTIRGLVINRFSSVDITLSSDNNVVEGNYIGTNVDGTTGFPLGAVDIGVAGSNNRIGGTDPSARNIISSSNGSGIGLRDLAEHNQIIGNFIGTDALGTSPLGNQFPGIDVRGSHNEIRRNLISGNGRYIGAGISLGPFGFGSENTIQGNYIGTDITGFVAMGNGRAGIDIGGNASGNVIGGTAPGQGNVIAYNYDLFHQSGAGVDVHDGAKRNTISGNSIFANQGLGIEISLFGIDPGVDPNDVGDADTGPNELQNYPTLLVAGIGTGTVTIIGTLASQPNTTYRTEFFSTSQCDPTGYGEGETFLGSIVVTTDGGGSASFATVLNATPPLGQSITAIATDPQGNTSEFSACIPLLATPPVIMPVSLAPKTLNLRSLGRWISATLEPPSPLDPGQIDVGSIRLNGTVSVDPGAPVELGDQDGDGIPDLTVRFDRGDVELALGEGQAVTVPLTGTIGGSVFYGSDQIKILRVAVTAPTAGIVLSAGSIATIQWDNPSGIQVESVAILWSIDDGATWTLDAINVPNTGSYAWRVPAIGWTDMARVSVVLVESADKTGYLVDGVLGMSDRFTIQSITGVAGPRAELALHALSPNPGKGKLRVWFSLPDAGPATVALYDVSGRRVVSEEVGRLGAGPHSVSFVHGPMLPAGIYLVRLTRGEQSLTQRAVLIQ